MSYYMPYEVFGVLSPQSLFSYVPCFSRLLKRYKSGISVRYVRLIFQYSYFDLAARVLYFIAILGNYVRLEDVFPVNACPLSSCIFRG